MFCVLHILFASWKEIFRFPTKSVIVFADPKVIESVAPMRGYVKNLFNNAEDKSITLTTKTYLYRQGRWT